METAAVTDSGWAHSGSGHGPAGCTLAVPGPSLTPTFAVEGGVGSGLADQYASLPVHSHTHS